MSPRTTSLPQVTVMSGGWRTLLPEPFEFAGELHADAQANLALYRAANTVTQEQVTVAVAGPPRKVEGEDARDVLDHVARVHRALAPCGVVRALLADSRGGPEVGTTGVRLLVQPAQTARPLREHIAGKAAVLSVHECVALAGRLGAALRAAHTAGVVCGPLTADSVLLEADGTVRIGDVTGAAVWGREGWCTGPGDAWRTPPESAGRGEPDPRDDAYWLGVLLTQVFARSCVDVLPDQPGLPERSIRQRTLERLTPPLVPSAAPAAFREAVTALLAVDPNERLPLDELDALLAPLLTEPDRPLWQVPLTEPAHREQRGGSGAAGSRERRELISGIVGHLARYAASNEELRPWPEINYAVGRDPATVQHGAAGTIATLASLVRHGDNRSQESELLRTLTNRLVTRLNTRGAKSITASGLHFGAAGVAWALAEAADVLEEPELLERARSLLLAQPARHTIADMTWGQAGLGTGLLELWRRHGDSGLRDRAVLCAEQLLSSRDMGDRPLWTFDMPAERVFGHCSYGYAHGSAGIGAFLLEAGRASGRAEFLTAADECGQLLLETACWEGETAQWPAGPDSTNPVPHWCHGSSGVGTFLLRLAAHTGDDTYLTTAVGAARAVAFATRWEAGTAQCHGLAGDGEFVLDLAEVTGAEAHREWAREFGELLWRQRVYREGHAVLADESDRQVTGGYGVGLTGHLAFLSRLEYGGARLFHPPIPGREEATGTPR